jgi:hypothetical protein
MARGSSWSEKRPNIHSRRMCCLLHANMLIIILVEDRAERVVVSAAKKDPCVVWCAALEMHMAPNLGG